MKMYKYQNLKDLEENLSYLTRLGYYDIGDIDVGNTLNKVFAARYENIRSVRWLYVYEHWLRDNCRPIYNQEARASHLYYPTCKCLMSNVQYAMLEKYRVNLQ